MARFWTCHWQNRFWHDDVNAEYKTVRSSGSNSFRKRGVSVGDMAFIISLADGQLLLGGRMTIKRSFRGTSAFGFGTQEPLSRGRVDHRPRGIWHSLELASPIVSWRSEAAAIRVAQVRTEELVPQSPKRNWMPKQQRGVRELTPESAALLERIIELTDRFPRSGALITVTEELLDEGRPQDTKDRVRLAEEVPIGPPAPRRQRRANSN